MQKKIILRISNEIGNQMFMYASAFSMSKILNRELFIDNETAFLSRKNISKYGLNNFNIIANIAEDNLKFKNYKGYIMRKLLKKTDIFRKKKFFFVEYKDKYKISSFNENYKNIIFSDNLFLEGHFESEKYFINYKEEIIKLFSFKNVSNFKDNQYYSKILNDNSVGICIRQNRFDEGKVKNNHNSLKSKKYSEEQIHYINKSVNIIKSKLSNPVFYLWSNDFSNIDYSKFDFDLIPVEIKNPDKNIDIRALSLFLLSNCKHFISAPSTFSWWGAWLSGNQKKIIMRPSKNFFSDFKVNNIDFWPSSWIKIT